MFIMAFGEVRAALTAASGMIASHTFDLARHITAAMVRLKDFCRREHRHDPLGALKEACHGRLI
jgi:hypothetical protein